MGNNSEMNPLQRRARCWGIFRRRFPNWADQVNAEMHTSSDQQQDACAATSDARTGSRRRYTPYAIPLHHWRSNLHKQDQTHVNMEGQQNTPERRMEGNRRDVPVGSWFKITIPFGIKYDEEWLLNLIQSKCSVSFTPVMFHYEKMQAQFYVENASIAFELKKLSNKIWDENNEMISIFVSPSDVPCSVQKELRSEKAEQIKLTMNKKCEASQQALNIQRCPFDPDLMTHTIEMAPNPGWYMVTSLNTHEENVSKVKSAGKMDKGKGLEPEQMSANIKPLCTTSSDKSSNINSILKLFPKLSCLDGQDTPRPTLCGSEAHKRLPTCKGSFFGFEMLKSVVLQFLQQYYLIYDYADRQSLLSAYHDEAYFSLSVLVPSRDPDLSSLCEYFKYNRNMKTVRDSYVQRQLLKHTKCDIVDTLRVLPKTHHDFSSFVVDLWFQTERMLCFSVNGLFKEVEGKSQGCVRAFTRTFITIPGSISSQCIINDKLVMKNASPQDTQTTFFIPMPTPSSSSEPALSQEQQYMLQAFSIESGMNLKCSQKWLEDYQWDYNRAALSSCSAQGKRQDPRGDPHTDRSRILSTNP